MDSDFVAQPRLVSRTLALMKHATVGLVQTPQLFFNLDPIQAAFPKSVPLADEFRFSYDTVQPAQDAREREVPRRASGGLGLGDLPRQERQGLPKYPDGEGTYGTTQHTSELVSLYAKGPGVGLLEQHARPYPNLPIVDDTVIYAVTLGAGKP